MHSRSPRPRPRPETIAILVFASLVSGGCVSRSTYDQQVQAASDAQAKLDRCRHSVSEMRAGSASMQKQMGEIAALDAQLDQLLERVDEKAGALKGFEGVLKSLGGAEAVRVYRLPSDALFDAGRAELKPSGKKALADIGAALAAVPGRRFQVAGHTDGEPLQRSPYGSNLQLSTERALAVVAFLTAQGVEPRALSASGYGEFEPIDSNATAEGRARNRRIEITIRAGVDDGEPSSSGDPN